MPDQDGGATASGDEQ